MATRAFLLCGDAKALEAVSQVLRELGVAFEHCHEPYFAVKKLANQHFDVILVDCENAQSALVVFNSARNSALNKSSLAIAIADGKADLANTFRLGASLVLTKPVSLEQARHTLRTALSMQRKEAQAGKGAAAPAQAPTGASEQIQSTTVREQSPGDAITPVIPAPPSPLPKQTAAHSMPAELPPAAGAPPLARAAAAGAAASPATTKMNPSPAGSRAVAGAPHFTDESPRVSPPDSARGKTQPPQEDEFVDLEPAKKPPAPSRRPAVPSSQMGQKPRRRTVPYVLAILAMLLAGAGFYAAWIVKPEFRSMVLAQYGKVGPRFAQSVEKAKSLVPNARPAAPSPAQSPVTSAPAATPAHPPAAGKVAPPKPATPDANAVAGPSPADSIPDGFGAAHGTPSPDLKGDSAANQSTADATPSATAHKVDTSDEPVVVAEKVADAHLVYRVRPTYPKLARRMDLQGAVVLQTVVNKDGKVDSVRVVRGDPGLARAAVEAVKQWRYEPYYHKGQPVDFQTQITVEFRLAAKTSN